MLKDRALGGLFFRLVSFEVILFERYDYTKDEAKVVWEHEVYFDCEYRIDCEFFHSFESDNVIIYGGAAEALHSLEPKSGVLICQ